MSEITRRNILRSGSAALTTLPVLGQSHHHSEAVETSSQPGGARFLQPHEFTTLEALCEVIVPADDHSPGAHEAGAAEYIDLLSRGNPKIAMIFHGGLAWINSYAQQLHGAPFAEITEPQKIAIAEKIADLDHAAPELRSGAIFFDWARRMTLDAFYTSRAGIQDLGYMGNKAVSVFEVPQPVMDQVLRRFEQEG